MISGLGCRDIIQVSCSAEQIEISNIFALWKPRKGTLVSLGAGSPTSHRNLLGECLMLEP